MKCGLNNKESFNIYPSNLITDHRNTIQSNELQLVLTNNQLDKRENRYPI